MPLPLLISNGLFLFFVLPLLKDRATSSEPASPEITGTDTADGENISSRYLRRTGGKETLGGLDRWFIPRGRDLAFLLSCIGLLGLRAALI
jgi:hypothetical protein